MARFSSFQETRDRLEKVIAEAQDPRLRRGLEDFLQHWWGEVIGDLDLSMAVFGSDVEFRNYGPTGSDVTYSVAERRAIYQAILDGGMCVGGSWDDEHFFFSDWGIVVEATWTFLHYPALIQDSQEPMDPESLYLVQRPLCLVMPLLDDGQLKGEICYIGTPSSVELADPARKRELFGEIESS